jgi:hypothetical protein
MMLVAVLVVVLGTWSVHWLVMMLVAVLVVVLGTVLVRAQVEGTANWLM